MPLLKSKKFWVMLLTVLGAVLAGSEGQPWYVVLAMSIGGGTYVIGQGLSDQGKEAAKLTLEAAQKGVAIAKGVEPLPSDLREELKQLIKDE